MFLSLAGLPVVLRSDDDDSFVLDEIAIEINKRLQIRHVTGSTYHPQSQGAVESMHKTLNQYVRGILQGDTERWEEALMFATLILRSAPMACLGGRCPYEVVTGLKPRMPSTLLSGLPVQKQTTDGYVENLLNHLRDVHTSVQRHTLAAIERDEASLGGRISAEINVGDTVLVRREATVERKGPTRFQSRVYDGVYVVRRKISPTTYEVEDLVDKVKAVPFKQPIHAERLVQLDMPELELRADQPRRLRMRRTTAQPWNVYTIERFGVDGRVCLRLAGGAAEWVDLTEVEYQWLQ